MKCVICFRGAKYPYKTKSDSWACVLMPRRIDDKEVIVSMVPSFSYYASSRIMKTHEESFSLPDKVTQAGLCLLWTGVYKRLL